MNMIKPYAPKVDPKSIYTRAARVAGLGWMLKDIPSYEALVALVEFVREQTRKEIDGSDNDGRC